jgi:hypothetical protein
MSRRWSAGPWRVSRQVEERRRLLAKARKPDWVDIIGFRIATGLGKPVTKGQRRAYAKWLGRRRPWGGR